MLWKSFCVPDAEAAEKPSSQIQRLRRQWGVEGAEQKREE